MIEPILKSSLLEEIKALIGSKATPPLLVGLTWIELDSGIWLVQKNLAEFIEKNIPEELHGKIKYAGLYIGKIRKNFGLSMEALYPLRSYITRYVSIKGKTLQKYLYGKPTNVRVKESEIDNLDLKKIIVMTTEGNPLGISKFTILEKFTENKEAYLHLRLEPITDLGLFLRKERTMFE